MFVRLANKGEYLKAENAEIPQEIMALIPQNIQLACWNYYSTDKKFYRNMLSMQQKFNRPLYYTSGAITWLGVTPMNKYSIKQNLVALKACQEKGVKNYTVAVWGDDGAECSLFACLPTLAYVASMARGEKNYKVTFEQVMGIPFDKFLRLDLPNEVVQPAKMFAFTQASRYMLYNDPLQGLYDSTVTVFPLLARM